MKSFVIRAVVLKYLSCRNGVLETDVGSFPSCVSAAHEHVSPTAPYSMVLETKHEDRGEPALISSGSKEIQNGQRAKQAVRVDKNSKTSSCFDITFRQMSKLMGVSVNKPRDSVPGTWRLYAPF